MKNKICYTIAAITFFALLGFTGQAENGGDFGAYIVKALVCLTVFGAAVFATMIEVKKADK